MRVDLYHHSLRNLDVQELKSLVSELIAKEAEVAGELAALQAQVAQNTTVIESAITLIQGIKAALDAAIASGNPQALTDLSATLGAEDQKLADAVAANTPTP